jgi:hypothetical protein
MNLDQQEQKQGIVWFLIAAPVAILLTIALYRVDETLTHSTADSDMQKTLVELRSAQSSLTAGESDPRLAATMSDVAKSDLVAVDNHSDSSSDVGHH